MAMLTAERRQRIMETLRRDGKVLASELSTTLSVSEDTIRRDLRELAEAGLLQRVHGGALPRSPADASYLARQSQAPSAKAAIAHAAVQLIRDRQVIILDGGTATAYIVGPLGELTRLVTERAVPEATLAPYRTLGITIIQG